MTAVDTNILVYAHRSEVPKHSLALKKLRALAEGLEPWAIAFICLSEFLRIVTHPKIFKIPTPLEIALSELGHILESPSLRLLFCGDRYWEFLKMACEEGKATGNMIFDAQIVAIALENGVDTILTEDHDFLRFRSVHAISLK